MLKVKKIHMDYQVDPMGVEAMPQFGWEQESDRRNVVQKSYRLQIAADRAFSELIYDSGQIQDSGSAHIFVRDTEIMPASKYFVRVRVWTAEEETGWSETAWFVTSLLRLPLSPERQMIPIKRSQKAHM